MKSKPNWITLVLKLFKKEIIPTKSGDDDLAKDYGDYLDKPQAYKDKVVKKMYRNTKYANEPPERLREIFKAQRESFGRILH